MRVISFIALILTAALPGISQTQASPATALPSDPRELFAAAAPFYDFTSPELKPWHLKATYQLYDENGKNSEEGSFEYWWASPQLYRSTWTRGTATHTDWHTDKRTAHIATGEPLNFFEYKLQSALISPLPATAELDPAKSVLDREFVGSKKAKFPCIMVIPQTPYYKQFVTVPLGIYPTYCFDPQNPILRVTHSFGTMTTEDSNIVKVQGRYLARTIGMYDGSRRILVATVDAIDGISPADPALTPPAAPVIAKSSVAPTSNMAGNIPKKITISSDVARSHMITFTRPKYPMDAQAPHITGTVLLKANIGTDGGIHDLRVISAPSTSLAISALWAVSQWQYTPTILAGEPVEIDTIVDVNYSLSH